MTDRVPEDQLDRQIRSFLSWQAEQIADAPTATEMAARVGSRVGTRPLAPRLSPALVWVVLAGLLILALSGALLAGGMWPRTNPVSTSYEAVFLRLEIVGASPEVLVVGVNTEGRERQIARLPGAWTAYQVDGGAGFLPPYGVVSSSGLLAIPSSRGESTVRLPIVHWEIIDLHRSTAEPLVVPGILQDVEQLQATPYYTPDSRPGVSWGPGDRLALPWYDRIPDPNVPNSFGLDYHLSFVDGWTGAAATVDLPAGLSVLPSWASDGSGVFVDGRRVLGPDGVVRETDAVAVPNCRTRDRLGTEISVLDGRVVRRGPEGSAERVVEAAGVSFACLAPDDSTLVLRLDREGPGARVIAWEAGPSFEVNGKFAGWLEVKR